MDLTYGNGGFPVPRGAETVRLVAAHHDACDGDTRVRLPRHLPARAVRRVVCDRCRQPYETEVVEDEGIVASLVAGPTAAVPVASPAASGSHPWRNWRWVSLALAGLAVFGALTVIQGDEEQPAPPVPGPDSAAAPQRGGAKAPDGARLVRQASFQLALPPGWERVAGSGAAFAATATDGDADARLWIERDAKLDFATFEARSLAQLESLAGSAAAVERNVGPTPEQTSIRLAPTRTPQGAPSYEVLLRASGNLWYYLATTSQPDASAAALDGIKLIQGSLIPQGTNR